MTVMAGLDFLEVVPLTVVVDSADCDIESECSDDEDCADGGHDDDESGVEKLVVSGGGDEDDDDGDEDDVGDVGDDGDDGVDVGSQGKAISMVWFMLVDAELVLLMVEIVDMSCCRR